MVSNNINAQRFKEVMRKYGRTGIITYLGLSTLVTTGFYIAIEKNVDVKKLVGIKDDPDKDPTWLQRVLLGPGSHLALAILCSKVMIPIKLPVAAALTPYVHRLEQRILQRAAVQTRQ
eukprot:jgi/Chrzof1/12243/Cz06g26240.t1